MSDMSDIAEGGTASQVRAGYRFNVSALELWMTDHVAGFVGPLQVEQFAGGQSNPTYRLRTPQRDYVMRRKPPGPVVPGAHAVDREARVLKAVNAAGLPVPQVYGLCLDAGVIGTSFYIMEFIEGRIFWDCTLRDVERDERPSYYDAMNAALADLHRIDVNAVGLSDFGRRGNYFERQINRWGRQYRDDPLAGANEDMDWLIRWLGDHVPSEQQEVLVHGDFRIDNLVFHPTEPRVVAILDWELSTLGSALSDFAYHAMMYDMPAAIVAGLDGVDLAAANIPTREEYAAQYCRRAGITSMPDWRFYDAFNFFRLAAIFHGIRGRLLRGNAVNENARSRAEAFPILARIARTKAEGG
jgi:aminoglycoside phosphotransferase (APT) family kinase protein